MTDSRVQQPEICPNCRRPITKHRPWCAKYKTAAVTPKEGDTIDHPIFGPTALISVYLRDDAINDGVLVDSTQEPFDELNRNAGLIFDVAMTRNVFERYVEIPAGFEKAQDIKGRYWDIILMYRLAAQRAGTVDELLFEFVCIPNGNDSWTNECPAGSATRRKVCLKAVARPGDRGEPCLTIMLPGED
jgi:hypothetical protein